MANKLSTAQANQAENIPVGSEIPDLNTGLETTFRPVRAADIVSASVGEIAFLVINPGAGKRVSALAAVKPVGTHLGRFCSGYIMLNGQSAMWH